MDGLPPDMELVFKTVPRPKDANPDGDISGGWVMAKCDLAGSMMTARLARAPVATVSASGFVFRQPVRVGDVLSFYARAERAKGFFIAATILVLIERVHAQEPYGKVTQANFIYEVVDDEGRPCSTPRPAYPPVSNRCS